MSLGNKDIIIGSGSLYCASHTADSGFCDPATVAVESKRLGHVKGGATISYNPEFYIAKDDLGIVQRKVITDEQVILKSGIMTLDLTTLEKLAQTAVHHAATTTPTAEDEYTTIGGMENYNEALYDFVFEHKENGFTYYVVMIGSPNKGFDLVFQKAQETVVDMEFLAFPNDGTGKRELVKIVKVED